MRASKIDFYCIFERIGLVKVCRPFDKGFCSSVAVLLSSRLVSAFLIVSVLTSGSRSLHVHLLDEAVELDVS